MKILQMLAAVGLMVASVGTATVADAQHRGDRFEQRYERGSGRVVRNDRGFRDDRGRRGFRDDRGRRGYRDDRGRRGYRNDRRGNRCRIERHRGRTVRVCR